MSEWLKVPDTHFMLDHIRPDFLLLRVSIQKTTEFSEPYLTLTHISCSTELLYFPPVAFNLLLSAKDIARCASPVTEPFHLLLLVMKFNVLVDVAW